MATEEFRCQICRSIIDLLPTVTGECLTGSCPACTQSALYEPRLQHAQVLIGNETLRRDIDLAITAGSSTSGSQPRKLSRRQENGDSVRRLSYEYARSKEADAAEKVRPVISHIEALRAEIRHMKLENAKRRAVLNKKRGSLKAIKQDLEQREIKATEPLQKSFVKTEQRWNALHTKTAESRAFLCREAANLCSLQHRKRKRETPGRDVYVIGGIPIIDLRDLNNANHIQLNASINHVAHLLHLTSHYLSLRLPAEISLPSPSNPFAEIYSLLSSYNTPTISQPRTKSPPPTITRRPRPLHLDKPLLTLATENPIAYSLFIDGITLLAWDVAWICKSQGLEIGSRSWEDVCAIGRNMWLLFVAPPNASSQKHLSDASDASPVKISRSNSLIDNTVKDTAPIFGHYSHGTSHSFLNAAEGETLMRGWKLANPVRVIEKVKAALASERMGAEWELLENGEWEEGNPIPIAVVGPERSRPDVASSAGPVKQIVDSPKGDDTETESSKRARGKSGWMKLKSRGTDS